MSTILDLTKIPATIVITNNYDAEAVKRPAVVIPTQDIKVELGATEPGAKEAVERCNFALIGEDSIQIQMYKNNTWITLEVGDSLEVVAKTSAELMYYMTLNNTIDFIDVEIKDSEEATE